jgi:hypothetical protein
MKQRPLTQFLALSVGLILLSAIVPVNAASLPPAQLGYTIDTDGVPLPPPGPPPKPSVMPAVTDGVPMPPPGPPPKP